MLKKIVIIGPESTGKSTLCEQLAAHYQAGWVKEYAREYLLTNGKDYTYDNLLDIARGQIREEESAVGSWQSTVTTTNNKHPTTNNKRPTTNNQLLFIDTDMYVMKVWCEFVFDRCHHWILRQIAERKYDLYLLCDVDLPWVRDELREYPDLETRNMLYHYYKDSMVSQSTPWVNIRGDYNERLRKAIDAINSLSANS
jgi:nicotinamide riboside kinase